MLCHNVNFFVITKNLLAQCCAVMLVGALCFNPQKPETKKNCGTDRIRDGGKNEADTLESSFNLLPVSESTFSNIHLTSLSVIFEINLNSLKINFTFINILGGEKFRKF